MIFDVKIHGKNYEFKDDYNDINAIGFFVYIFINANDIDSAKSIGIINLCNNQVYIDNVKPAETAASELVVEEVSIANYTDFIPNQLSEFILYKNDDLKDLLI